MACLLLFHQAVVRDDQRAGGHIVQAGAVAADEQPGSQVVRQRRLEPLQGLDIQVWAGWSLTSLQAIWLPARSWPGKPRPPSDPGDRVDVSDALSGACTGKAPGWQAGPNVENLRTGTFSQRRSAWYFFSQLLWVFSTCFGPCPRSALKPRVLPRNRRW